MGTLDFAPVKSVIAPPLLIVLALVLVGCGGVRKLTGGGPDPFAEPADVPDHLRADGGAGQARVRLAPVGEDPAEFARSMGDDAQASLLTPEDDIVWTDPDNPDAELADIEDLIRAGRNRDDWEVSLTDARRYAMREGVPLLIWFTDSERSSVCRTLSTELFSTTDFDSWARDNLVRVRLDWSAKTDGGDSLDQMDARARRREYLAKVEKRYKVAGKPHVVVMAPDGTVTGHHRGYRPDSADFFWGKLKHSTILAKKHHDDWAAKMRRKGYRVWTSRRGDFSSFAKLLRYREGELILVEPGGVRFRTRETNLSADDRAWIEREKAKRR